MFAQAPPTTAEPSTEGTVEPSAVKRPEDVRGMVKNQDFVIWSLVLAGILLLAAVVFLIFDRWRKKPVVESARDLSLSLNSFKEMYENGELTEAEYEKIKAKWAAKLREKSAVPAAPPPDPPPTGPTPPADAPTA
jgi:uncharacterized membrane protein